MANYVKDLINPKSGISKNHAIMMIPGLNLLYPGTYKTMGKEIAHLASGWKSGSGSSLPDIERGCLRFPRDSSRNANGDIRQFALAAQNIENEKTFSVDKAEKARLTEKSIRNLYGKNGANDKTLILCDRNNPTEIASDSQKPHRITLSLNPDPEKTDDFVAALQVAEFRQERLRTMGQRNGASDHQGLMPDASWCQERGITITPGANGRYAISSTVQDQNHADPAQNLGGETHVSLPPSPASPEARISNQSLNSTPPSPQAESLQERIQEQIKLTKEIAESNVSAMGRFAPGAVRPVRPKDSSPPEQGRT